MTTIHQDKRQTGDLQRKLLTAKLQKICLPEEIKSQIDMHEETRAIHQKFVHTILVMYSPTFAVDARKREQALKYN